MQCKVCNKKLFLGCPDWWDLPEALGSKKNVCSAKCYRETADYWKLRYILEQFFKWTSTEEVLEIFQQQEEIQSLLIDDIIKGESC